MLPLLVYAQDAEDFYITGTVSGYVGKKDNSATAHLVRIYNGETITESSVLNNGVFKFKGSLPEPMIADISLSHPGDHQDFHGDSKRFYLEKGHIQFIAEDSIKHASVSGSPLSSGMYAYQELVDSVRTAYNQFNDLRYSRRSDSLFQAQVVKPTLAKLEVSLDSLRKLFITDNPESLYSLDVIKELVGNSLFDKYRNTLTNEQIEAIKGLFDSLSEEVQHSERGQKTLDGIKGLSGGMVGEKVIHFTGKGLEGENVDTRKLVGKVYLIDFWGSWCPSCRESHPHLKELYNAYKDKGFEIVAVAKEHGNEEKQIKLWREAVEKDGISWIQVLNSTAGTDVVTAFGVVAFPTKILIDRDGTILLRVTDDHERTLDAKLIELFTPAH
ncbi:TlpA disulfide reductase family protein [Belliella marina]|uniref:TlpA disulfide reductase family protein n=1 Tax=Belliella marina TaxID=1644146 RepID=A0ABW4VP71_9BACT